MALTLRMAIMWEPANKARQMSTLSVMAFFVTDIKGSTDSIENRALEGARKRTEPKGVDLVDSPRHAKRRLPMQPHDASTRGAGETRYDGDAGPRARAHVRSPPSSWIGNPRPRTDRK
jgi:hypothetical protein